MGFNLERLFCYNQAKTSYRLSYRKISLRPASGASPLRLINTRTKQLFDLLRPLPSGQDHLKQFPTPGHLSQVFPEGDGNR